MVAACKEIEDWNLRHTLLDVAADIKRRKDDLREPATVPGIIARGGLLEVIGGFDFYDMLRFEQRCFVRLGEVLDVS